MIEDDLLRDVERQGYGWEEAPDLTSISEKELKESLRELVEEEQAVSYRRRVLQGRIDLIRTQLVRRGDFAVSPEEFARALLGEESSNASRRREGGS